MATILRKKKKQFSFPTKIFDALLCKFRIRRKKIIAVTKFERIWKSFVIRAY